MGIVVLNNVTDVRGHVSDIIASCAQNVHAPWVHFVLTVCQMIRSTSSSGRTNTCQVLGWASRSPTIVHDCEPSSVAGSFLASVIMIIRSDQPWLNS